MSHPKLGGHRSVEAFRRHLQSVDAELDCDDELLGAGGPLGRTLSIGDRVIGNRFAIHPMEGWDGTPDGMPTEQTLRRWRRFGKSGAKLIWGGEAFAVQADGRANPHQLARVEGAETAGGLASLLAALKDAHRGGTDDLFVGLQLTHSGRFARPTEAGAAPRIAYRHPVLDERLGLDASHPVLTDGELEAIGESFVRAAALADDAGFDFVDVKCCHGYLLHELLSARSRAGRYGGSFGNRTRFFRELVGAIRAACPRLEIGVRISIADAYPFFRDEVTGVGVPRGWEQHVPYDHGFGVDAADPRRIDLDEPLRFLGLVGDLGIHLVNVTIGSPYYCPHVQRPAAYPPSDGYLPPEDPLAGVARHVRLARAVKHAFPELRLVGTGYSYLQEWLPHVAQHEVGRGHVDFVGLGRMVLAYPELPADVLARRALAKKRICRTFSDCTTGPRHGLPSGCYPLDPYYRGRPEAALVKRVRAEAIRSPRNRHR